MNEIYSNLSDEAFLNSFFDEEEISDELLTELDKRLCKDEFRSYYELQLKERYENSDRNLFALYLPMIIFVILIICGIFLILN